MTFQAAKWALREAYKNAVGLEKDVVIPVEVALAILKYLYKRSAELSIKQIEARQRTRAAQMAARAAKIEESEKAILNACRPIAAQSDAAQPVAEAVNPPVL
jgi:hypothetical protein